jgi:hypothetical protein
MPLQWRAYGRATFSVNELGLAGGDDDHELSPNTWLRTAVKKQFKSSTGDLSMPKARSLGRYRLFGRCFNCVDCHAGNGTRWSVVGKLDNGCVSREISKTGDCSGGPRGARRPDVFRLKVRFPLLH